MTWKTSAVCNHATTCSWFFFCSIRKAGSDHCAQDKVPAIVWDKVGGKAACSTIDSQSRMKMQGWKKWEWKFVDEKLGNKVLRSRSAAYDSCFAHNAHCCLLRLHPLLYCLHNCSTDFSSLGFNYACQAFKKVTSNQKSDFFLDPIEHGSLFFNGP